MLVSTHIHAQLESLKAIGDNDNESKDKDGDKSNKDNSQEQNTEQNTSCTPPPQKKKE